MTLGLPLGGVVYGALADGGWSGWGEAALDLSTKASTWRSLGFSLAQAGLSALFTILLALPGSFALVRYRFRGKKLIRALGMASFVMPSLLIILGVVSFYGRSGVLNAVLGTDFSFVYSPVGIIIAHMMFNGAIALGMLSQGWADMDPRQIEASRSLGDSPLQRIFRLYLPFLTRRIISAYLLIFLYCFLSFSIVLLFGGVGFVTLEVQIYREMYVALRPAGAGFLVFLQLGVTSLLAWGIQKGGKKRESVRGKATWEELPMRTLRPSLRAAWGFYWVFVFLVLVAPLVAFAFRSFRVDGQWSLEAYRLLVTGRAARGTGANLERVIRGTLAQALGTSLSFAVLTGLVTSVSGYLAARSLGGRDHPGIDLLFLLPLVVSGVTLSLGIGMLLRGVISPTLLIVLVQSTMAFPLVFRFFREAFRSFPPSYTEASRSLGARGVYGFRHLELPLLAPAVIQGFSFGAAVSLGDFTAVYTLGRGDIVTIPIALFRLIGFQHFTSALALGVGYMILSVGIFFIGPSSREYL